MGQDDGAIVVEGGTASSAAALLGGTCETFAIDCGFCAKPFLACLVCALRRNIVNTSTGKEEWGTFVRFAQGPILCKVRCAIVQACEHAMRHVKNTHLRKATRRSVKFNQYTITQTHVKCMRSYTTTTTHSDLAK